MATKKKKSTAEIFDFNKEDAELFKDVVYMVEATYNEQHQFWHDYHYKPKYDNCKIENWEQVMMGRGITIGTVDDRPIVVSINWAILEGYKVMFYEGISQLVDHAMIDQWVEHYGENIKCDNGHRWAHTDATNFAHCIHAIQQFQERDGKSPKQREQKINDYLKRKSGVTQWPYRLKA